MFRFDMLIGTKIGKLTLIELFYQKNRPYFKCKCDCGNIVNKSARYIRKTERTNCGCDTSSFKNLHYIDLSGKQFGNLFVIKKSHVGNVDNAWYYLVRCVCGKETIMRGAEVSKGNYKSCGCIQYQSGKNGNGWKGYEGISSSHFSSIKSGAKIRGLEFKITIEYVWNLYVQQNKRCALTNLPINFTEKVRDFNGTASLDRIDSSKGYIEGNVQWVHKYINKMKWDLSQKEFIKFCILVADFNKSA